MTFSEVFTDIKGWEVDIFQDLEELYSVRESLADDVSCAFLWSVFRLTTERVTPCHYVVFPAVLVTPCCTWAAQPHCVYITGLSNRKAVLCGL